MGRNAEESEEKKAKKFDLEIEEGADNHRQRRRGAQSTHNKNFFLNPSSLVLFGCSFIWIRMPLAD